MRLGIGSYTLGWAVGVRGHAPKVPLTETDLLDWAARERVSVVQIGDNLPLHQLDTGRMDALAALAKSRGIELEVGTRRLTTERVSQYITIADRLGARLMRVVIDDAEYHPDPKSVTAILREIAPLLKTVRLGIENHDRFKAATLRGIIEAAGSDRIGVCLDTANSLGAGEGIEAVAEILGPLTINLHIKDFWVERVPHLMGFTVTGRPAGSGMLDIPRLLRTIARFKRCETAILELWTPPEPRIEETIAREARWAAESLEYLKPLFK